MKTKYIMLSLTMAFCMFFVPALAKDIDKEDIIGTWDIQGTLVGDDGEGILLPHKQANPECEANHTVFSKSHTAKEVRYNTSCEITENAFDWKLQGNILTLTSGERSINWFIQSVDDGTMTVGVQVRPDSERRMYVVYKKRN